MDSDPLSYDLKQPALFNFSETSTGAMELFPSVWTAAEALTSPEPEDRLEALDQLTALQAPRLSPLVAYLVATRLMDPDLQVRKRVIRVLGEVLSPDERGFSAPDAVYRHLTGYLSQMRTRPVFALAEAAAEDKNLETLAARLLNACPYGGIHLSEILTDRQLDLGVRRVAVRLIGRVGYLDAISALEKMAARLETRLKGQQTMPFAPPSAPDESDLLPEIQTTLLMLKSA